MKDICQLLGIKKLNTMAYHPQCDGMVERFNRTLKAMLRKQAATYGAQWDRYLSSVLWAYRNIPHETTGEKPSFLLFGYDCRTPSEAALLPPSSLDPTTISDYREHVMLSLSSARDLAVQSIKQAQIKYKKVYDKKSVPSRLQVGDWVLVRFPQDEVGKMRKLSRPWHGPYRILLKEEPDVTVIKVYFPQDQAIRVHLSRVTPCPSEFPPGFYWYGTKRHSPGRPPKWVQQLLSEDPSNESQEPDPQTDSTLTSTADLEPDPEPQEISDGKDGVEFEPVVDATLATRGHGHYSLRNKVSTSQRLMVIQSCSRSSSSERGSDVANL